MADIIKAGSKPLVQDLRNRWKKKLFDLNNKMKSVETEYVTDI